MTTDELKNAIGFLYEPNAVIGLELYLVLDTEQGLILRLADLGDGNLPTEVKNGFLNYIKGRTFQNGNDIVKPLSELNSDRVIIHHYDLEGWPEGLEIINSNLNPDEIPVFNFNTDKLEKIVAFLIKLSSVDKSVVLYKKHLHLNLLQQSKVFYFVNDQERFSKPKEGVLRFSFTVDFLKVDNQLMVYDINCLEKEFKFDNILINNAKQKVNSIVELDFVDNIQELIDFAKDKTGARKVLSIKPNSPVLSLQFTQIKTFVKNHPYLKKRLKFNGDESKFHFHTQISKVYFIDLLNDNFLTSDLTSIFYKTNEKNKMEEEAGEENIQE